MEFIRVRDKHNETYLYPINRIKKIQCFNNGITDRVWFDDDKDYYECVDSEEKKKYGDKVSIKESIITI